MNQTTTTDLYASVLIALVGNPARHDLYALMDAHADEVAELRALLREFLHLDLHPRFDADLGWQCSVCERYHTSMATLERGEGHANDCAYARARALLGE